MPTNYIKVRPYVAKKMGVFGQRYIYADGNVQLWEKDLSNVDHDWAFFPAETVARIGGVMFDPYSNRDEQRKSAENCTPLPMPTDPEWMGFDEAEEVIEQVVDEIVEDILEEAAEQEEGGDA